MNGYITIGQLADMMKISTHQIRYFEEKDVLLPAHIGNNGYRMYGLDEVFILMHILFLRELDVSVQDIHTLRGSGTKSDYIKVLKTKLEDVKTRIKKLDELKTNIESILLFAEEVDEQTDEIILKNFDETLLKEIARYDCDYNLTAKDLLDLSEEHHLSEETVIYQLYDTQHCYICLETDRTPDHILKKGQYLYFNVLVNNEKIVDQKIKELYEYAIRHEYSPQGKLIVIQDSHLSIFENDALYIRIQLLI